MRIRRISISNYRNIDGIVVDFHPEANYIIGDNNLGKTNFLSVLETVCLGKCFNENDFYDINRPISITLTFDNHKIKYAQRIDQAFPNIVNRKTGRLVNAKQLRKLHFIKLDSNRLEDVSTGASLILNRMIHQFIQKHDDDFLNDERLQELTDYMNDYFGKLHGFRDFSVHAQIQDETLDVLSRLFYLSDDHLNLERSGSGARYMSMAAIHVLVKIMELYNHRAIDFENELIHENGLRLFPLVLAIDEPEIHLHPFLQRSLIQFYKKILKNEDPAFLDLLKLCFGIDGLSGQLIVVTHSTDALVDDYRNLIRFHRKNGSTRVVCGPVLSDLNEKHLWMHFPEIKECFYAHCVILIEGETEYGCIRGFADHLGISLDEHGISVINARGQGSIKPLRKLLASFGIYSVVIYDNDVKKGQTPGKNEFFTKEECFEIEVVAYLYDHGQLGLVKDIICERDEFGLDFIMDIDYVRRPFAKLGLDGKTYKSMSLRDVDDHDRLAFCSMYASWMMKHKGILMGRIIGELLSENDIPSCYKNAIYRAKEIAQSR